MKKVFPITDKKLIEKIKLYLKQKDTRSYILFLIGINTGLRISDILRLKVSDIKNKKVIHIKEGKTRKDNFFQLNMSVRKEVQKYLLRKNLGEYIFTPKFRNNALSRTTAHYIMKDIEREFKLENFGCHSLRKTFGYWHYKKYNDISVLMYTFNHSNELMTMKYIGLTQEIKDNYMKKLYI